MLRTIFCVVTLSVLTFSRTQPATEVERLKAGAMKGSVEDANALSKLNEKPAIEAMREVLKKSDKVPVKIAMIQGLGHNNKDLESVPLFLDIMEKDDDLSELRTKANEAVEICGVPGRFYKAANDIDERKDIVRLMRHDLRVMKELKAGPTLNGRPIPNAKILVRESIFKDTYCLSLPFVENGVRMRISKEHPQNATSYHLEIEAADEAFRFNWYDLIMRVDVQQDGSMKLTAVRAVSSPYSFDLVDSNGKMLVYDFGPNTGQSTYTFPK